MVALRLQGYKDPLTQLWEGLYNMASSTIPPHHAICCDIRLNFTVFSRPKSSKAIAHAISFMCSFSVESSPTLPCLANSYSSFKAHPKFLLPVPELSHFLGRVGYLSSELPCSSLTSLSHWCLCLPLSFCLWGYGWGRSYGFLKPFGFTSQFSSIHPTSGNDAPNLLWDTTPALF